MQSNSQSKFKSFLNSVKKFFLECNTPRLLIIKSAILISVLTVVITIVFVVRDSLSPYYSHSGDNTIIENGFINIVLTLNKGIGFGGLQDNTAAVYALQSIVMLFMLAWILFADRCEFFVSLSMVVSGALSNILDRATSTILEHAVLDYFQFWFGGAIFNFADVCVVVGFIILVISFIVHWVMEWVQDAKESKKAHLEKMQKMKEQHTPINKDKDVSSDAFA